MIATGRTLIKLMRDVLIIPMCLKAKQSLDEFNDVGTFKMLAKK